MFTEAFWSDVLSNLIPDFVIGVLIVGAISYINAYNEKREIEFKERKKKEQKAIGYMKTILIEIVRITNTTQIYMENENYSQRLFLSTYIWDSLILVGELPTVLNSSLFFCLSRFYEEAQETKRLTNLIFETKLFRKEFLRKDLESELIMNLKIIQYAQNENGLIYLLRKCINISVDEVEKINIEIRKSNPIYIIQDFFKMKISKEINKLPPRY